VKRGTAGAGREGIASTGKKAGPLARHVGRCIRKASSSGGGGGLRLTTEERADLNLVNRGPVPAISKKEERSASGWGTGIPLPGEEVYSSEGGGLMDRQRKGGESWKSKWCKRMWTPIYIFSALRPFNDLGHQARVMPFLMGPKYSFGKTVNRSVQRRTGLSARERKTLQRMAEVGGSRSAGPYHLS